MSRTADYFSSDLLILDDLGTEMTTQFAVSALYQLLNSRLLENRPTIVSTNLPLGDIAPRYSAQIYCSAHTACTNSTATTSDSS